MASRILTPNFRLAVTSKLWSDITKKKYSLKKIKINYFFNVFLYYYLLFNHALSLFYYKLIRDTNLFWSLSIFVFKSLRNFYKFKDIRVKKYPYLAKRKKDLFFKRRRPFTIAVQGYMKWYFGAFKRFGLRSNIFVKSYRKLFLSKNKNSFYWRNKIRKFKFCLLQYKKKKKIINLMLRFKRISFFYIKKYFFTNKVLLFKKAQNKKLIFFFSNSKVPYSISNKFLAKKYKKKKVISKTLNHYLKYKFVTKIFPDSKCYWIIKKYSRRSNWNWRKNKKYFYRKFKKKKNYSKLWIKRFKLEYLRSKVAGKSFFKVKFKKVRVIKNRFFDKKKKFQNFFLYKYYKSRYKIKVKKKWVHKKKSKCVKLNKFFFNKRLLKKKYFNLKKFFGGRYSNLKPRRYPFKTKFIKYGRWRKLTFRKIRLFELINPDIKLFKRRKRLKNKTQRKIDYFYRYKYRSSWRWAVKKKLILVHIIKKRNFKWLKYFILNYIKNKIFLTKSFFLYLIKMLYYNTCYLIYWYQLFYFVLLLKQNNNFSVSNFFNKIRKLNLFSVKNIFYSDKHNWFNLKLLFWRPYNNFFYNNVIFARLFTHFRLRFFSYKTILFKDRRKLLLLKYFNLLIALQLNIIFKTNFIISVITISQILSNYWVRFYKRSYKVLIKKINFPKSQLYWFKRTLLVFLLGFKFKNFKLFLRLLGLLFLKNKRHWFIIRFYKVLIQKGFFNLKSILGLQFSVKGKMNRRPRARRILFFRGQKPPFQNIQLRVIYSSRQVITYFGAYMFRFWVYTF